MDPLAADLDVMQGVNAMQSELAAGAGDHILDQSTRKAQAARAVYPASRFNRTRLKTGGDLRQAQIAEEGQEVQPDAGLVTFDPLRAALAEGVAAARDEVATVSAGLGANINGWMSMNAFGDRQAYGGDYLRRAAESMVGWGGNDKIEADYPIARVDGDGNPFDGSAKYQATFIGKR